MLSGGSAWRRDDERGTPGRWRAPWKRLPARRDGDRCGDELRRRLEVADGLVLCLFDETGAETRIRVRDYDAGVWHAFVPGVAAGQAYGFRATGPWDPARGARCNPARLLLDPYARALHGTDVGATCSLPTWPGLASSRNTTLTRGVAMGARRRRSDRAVRPAMYSPGHPSVGRRDERQRFWAAIARGVSTVDAAGEAGVSEALASGCFREGGAMPVVTQAPFQRQRHGGRRRTRSRVQPAPLAEALTDREAVVSNHEIASELFTSVSTVKTDLPLTYRKLGANDRREAVQRAREVQLLAQDLGRRG